MNKLLQFISLLLLFCCVRAVALPENLRTAGNEKDIALAADPILTPTITTSGSPAAMLTVYGTPSTSSSFTVTGNNTTGVIVANAPIGFEVSSDNVNFRNSCNLPTAGGTVYVRIAANTPVVANYSDQVLLTSSGAADVNVTVTETVTPAPLSIMVKSVSKTYGDVLTSGPGYTAFTSTGLQNGETIGSITITYGQGGAQMDGVSTYTGSITTSDATGGTFLATNYSIDYEPADITVNKALLYVTADDKMKAFDTPNPELTATYKGLVGTDEPSDLVPEPILSTVATLTSPPGKYNISLTIGTVANYTIIPTRGTMTILGKVTVPNAFTPNGDGINDTWEIASLNYYIYCTVSVFNRYGTMLYHSHGYSIPWDGTYNNKALPTGVYYYIINLGDGSPPMAGPVTIIK